MKLDFNQMFGAPGPVLGSDISSIVRPAIVRPAIVRPAICLASLAICLAPLLSGCSQADHAPQAHSRYHAGERWSYKTRDGEEKSTLVIGSVEAAPREQTTTGKTIVHISIEGLKLAGPEGRVLDHIGHLPLSQEAVDRSVTALVGQNALPTSDYGAGYEYWKSAGSGGVFGMTVKQAVNYYEQIIQPRHKKAS
ncbi:MAG: hypothetical protein KGS72_14190 [Cyanobacteria bacterium REEB67]|nr:hypothetical protein [Cyanobacteria bacterium REEB67]